MREAPDASTGLASNLLPHQAALLSAFFSTPSHRILLLRADLGLGKNEALAALVGQLLVKRPIARVLFIVSNSMQAPTVEALTKSGVASLLVDRYRFRELLDRTPRAKGVWPAGMAMVVSSHLAGEP